MEEKKVELLKKLRQKYLNALQIGEKDSIGNRDNFVFSGDLAYADGGKPYIETYTGEWKGFSYKELFKRIEQFKEYIRKNGVDDKFLQEFSEGYKSVQYPDFVVYDVAQYICELNRPDYVLKLLDLERCFWRRTSWKDVIIGTNNAEYIKLAIEKLVSHKSEYEYVDYNDKQKCEKIYKITYKELKKAYKQAVKSNKAGV